MTVPIGLSTTGARAVPAGPLLFLHGGADGRVALSVVSVVPAAEDPPALRTPDGRVEARVVSERDGWRIVRYGFALPQETTAWYELGGARYDIDTALGDDLRIAFVACNGQEQGDRQRRRDERNVLWRRLQGQHGARPFQLLLHGGDQIYADELVDCHPLVRAWSDGRPDGLRQPATADVVAALRRAFFHRYLDAMSQPEMAWMMARVPSLAIWDDHDICDGWGSMSADRLDAPIGQALFAVAREHFLLFQMGADPDSLPAICRDRSGASLGWHVRLPGLDVIAPDLRSERRPDRVMGEAGWRALDVALDEARGRILLLSSVPALGPRLSVVEALLQRSGILGKYQDDLRDQWQSRAHRAEWRRFLERLAAVHARRHTTVTILSGEIHLATRGTLEVPPAPLHQLVASGITHPPPPVAAAWLLGALARLGDTPVPDRPIRLHPLPGRNGIYTAERNYLVLERRGQAWSAWWELEHGGPTPALPL